MRLQLFHLLKQNLHYDLLISKGSKISPKTRAR